MDAKRPVDIGNIGDGGFLICKCGRFGIYLTHDGDFKIIDEISGITLEHLSAADTHDLCDASHSIEEWGLYHNIKR
jgi:hypothetical protein